MLVLLLLVGVVGAGTLAVLRVRSVRGVRRRAALSGGAGAPALGAGAARPDRPGDGLRIAVGDVVCHGQQDYLVQGALTLTEEAGAERCAFRLLDGDQERWLLVRRGPSPELVLLGPLPELVIEGRPPGQLEHDGLTYRLEAHGLAVARRAGELGPLPPGELVRYWDYGAPGDRRLRLEDWSGPRRTQVGTRLRPDALDVLPGR